MKTTFKIKFWWKQAFFNSRRSCYLIALFVWFFFYFVSMIMRVSKLLKKLYRNQNWNRKSYSLYWYIWEPENCEKMSSSFSLEITKPSVILKEVKRTKRIPLFSGFYRILKFGKIIFLLFKFCKIKMFSWGRLHL